MKILTYPHPVLAYESKPIKKIDQALRDIAAEMLQLMYENEGVGLAANQVGLPWQMFVMNAQPDNKEEEHVFINPVIRKMKGNVEENEGCLSFPDLRIMINRAEAIQFQAIDLNGQIVNHTWKGFAARIVQHETDHLHGRCFYERAALTGELKAKEMLQSMEQVYHTDEEMGLVPTREEIMAEMIKLEEERT